MKLKTKHLLTIRDLSPEEVRGLVERARVLKESWPRGERPRPLLDKTVALVFEKPSTRTRVSFEVATLQLGGNSLFMASRDTQLARSEPLADTARVMSRYVDAVVVRTFGHEVVEGLAGFSEVPVINALTDRYHPCQVLSDLLTVSEKLDEVTQLKYCWIGDGNNMAHSWLELAACLNLELSLACPRGFLPDPAIVDYAKQRGARITLSEDPSQAVAGAHVVSTDVWASMGQEDDAARRRRAFDGFTVDDKLMSLADSKAMVLHCLPAHRGEEISDQVMEGPQSVVWDQAENRLHMQKAILEALAGE